MNLTLLTHYLPTAKENYQLVADLTIPGREAYCERHGYRHLVHSGPYANPSEYYAIQRLRLVYDYLFAAINDVDYVWVLNVQSLVTNLSLPITQLLDDQHDLFVHEDINGLNAASLILRKSDWTKRYLEMLIPAAAATSHCWHEQKILQDTYKSPEWSDKIKTLVHPAANSYMYVRYGRGPDTPGDWRKGHLVLSLPGITFTERLSFITTFLAGDNIVY